jgi:hypothetical protein
MYGRGGWEGTMMSRHHITRSRLGGAANAARIVAGLIWLAGAAFNAVVTLRMDEPYAWLETSPVPFYRWFFADVVKAHPSLWTMLLVIGELALGTLTLARGRWARLGLTGGAVFSALLCSLASIYTLVMGPYALLLGWLGRGTYERSPLERISARVASGGDRRHEPA